jgi:hypothetical protein
MITTRLAILVTGALMAFGCTKPAKTGASAGVPARDPKAPVAKIGGQAITEGELAKESKAEISRAETQHMEKVHQIREQALDSLIEKRLIREQGQGRRAELGPAGRARGDLEAAPADRRRAEDDVRHGQGSGPAAPALRADQAPDRQVPDRSEQGPPAQGLHRQTARRGKVEVLLPPLLLPKVEVALEGQSRGPSNAPITIVEFSDFQCPYCSRAEETVKKVMDTYKGKIRLFYRDYPLPFHGQAQKASEAALCAGDQNKYWKCTRSSSPTSRR